MKRILRFGLMSTLLLGTFGCTAESSEKAAADASGDAAAGDARVNSTKPTATRALIPPKAKLVIPSGTLFKVSLIDSLGTDTSLTGDRFLANLSESVVIEGTTVLQRGTQLQGRVVAVEGSGRVKGLAGIQLALTDILQGGRMIAITTETFAATAEPSKTRDG